MTEPRAPEQLPERSRGEARASDASELRDLHAHIENLGDNLRAHVDGVRRELRKDLATTREENREQHAQVEQRIGGLDTRLGAVERRLAEYQTAIVLLVFVMTLAVPIGIAIANHVWK